MPDAAGQGGTTSGHLTAIQRAKVFLQPWHDAVANPAETQQGVLRRLLEGYARTEYGARYGADQLSSIVNFRKSFPVVTYEDYKPGMTARFLFVTPAKPVPYLIREPESTMGQEVAPAHEMSCYSCCLHLAYS